MTKSKTKCDGKKMEKWIRQLKHNPVPSLTGSENAAISYLAKRDLLEDKKEPIEKLWDLREPKKLLTKQQKDGSWNYPNPRFKIRSQENYNQIETFRTLGILIEQYGFNRKHPAIENAAEFLFKFQTEEGDIRGILENQYMPYYTAAMMELIIKAGFEKESRIEAGFHWLLSIRQDDGGWAFPPRTRTGKNALTLVQAFKEKEPIKPDTTKPFSHLITGMVLRAFAAHTDHRKDPHARIAAELLKTRFFKPDKYPDRKAPSFWIGFSYPFWFTDLLSSLDSLSKLNFSPTDPDIKKGLEWFINKQEKTGNWKLKTLRGANSQYLNLWLSLAISRVFKTFYSEP